MKNQDLRARAMVAKNLGKAGKPVLSKAAVSVSKPSRQMIVVQLDKLFRLLKDGEKAIVPGKVIGVSTRTTKAIVYADSFTGSAKARIVENGGKAILLRSVSLEELKKLNSLRLIQ